MQNPSAGSTWVLKTDKNLTLTVCVLALLLASAVLTCLLAQPMSFGTFANGEGTKLPILMYHGLLKDPGQWGTYVISPTEFDNDLKYLRDSGYTAVTMDDLIAHVYDGAALPDKPVMITLDDGYYNNYLYAYPLLKKYNMKAILSIIGRYTDQYSLSGEVSPIYSHVTWQQINEMIDSGCIEIQNHSYNLHSISPGRTASMKVSGETMEHYKTALLSDTIRLQAQIDSYTRRMPTTYTYPFGLISKESIDILKEVGFKATLTCYSGINHITDDPQCLFQLKRLLRQHGVSAESLLNKYK
jgi:poly-beta-1,6-N-acetyl-D-glucosamine N-deacetylase